MILDDTLRVNSLAAFPFAELKEPFAVFRFASRKVALAALLLAVQVLAAPAYSEEDDDSYESYEDFQPQEPIIIPGRRGLANVAIRMKKLFKLMVFAATLNNRN